MTRESVTIWTCDRCGATTSTKGTGEQPKWLGLTFGAPPEADTSEWVRMHLCKNCDHDFTKFIRPIERVAISKELA